MSKVDQSLRVAAFTVSKKIYNTLKNHFTETVLYLRCMLWKEKGKTTNPPRHSHPVASTAVRSKVVVLLLLIYCLLLLPLFVGALCLVLVL